MPMAFATYMLVKEICTFNLKYNILNFHKDME